MVKQRRLVALLLGSVLSASAFFASLANAQPLPPASGATPVVAVTTFVSKDPALGESGADLLADLVSQALGKAGVRVAERRDLDAALREQELALSGITDSSGAIVVGKLSEARYVLSGSAYALPGAVFVSGRLIDTTTGEVLKSAVRKASGDWASSIESLASGLGADLAAALPGTRPVAAVPGSSPASMPPVAALAKGEAPQPEARWVADAPAPKGARPGQAERGPVLIYVMSNVEDSVDGQGISWYLGPERLGPVTEALKRAGLGSVVMDRNLMPSLARADLSSYSMILVLDGDANGKVDVKKADQDALYAFYKAGGVVWISAEAESSAMGLGDYREDGSALAKPWGYAVKGLVFPSAPALRVEPGTHALFGKAAKLAFDAEIGYIEGSHPRGKVLMTVPPDSRLADPRTTLDKVLGLAQPDRLKAWTSGKRPEIDFGWLLGANFKKIGKEAGSGVACMVLVDERDRGSGSLLIDSGWILGWAFNGPLNGRESTWDDLLFIESFARWALGAGK